MKTLLQFDIVAPDAIVKLPVPATFAQITLNPSASKAELIVQLAFASKVQSAVKGVVGLQVSVGGHTPSHTVPFGQ